MSGIESNIDWAAAAQPRGERVGPGIALRPKAPPAAGTKRDVMETLLGKHDLSAIDSSGGDPYNATGRHFRG